MRLKTALFLLTATIAFATSATAETVWATEDVGVLRWQDNVEITSGDVKIGDRLDVIHRKDGWLRVKLPGANSGFGWIEEAKVTAERPATEDGFDLDLPGGLELPGGQPGRTLPPINLDLK